MIDTRDVAAVAAEIAAAPAAHAGRPTGPPGPRRSTFAEAAAALSKVLGRPITFQPLTVEEQTRAMVDIGTAGEPRRR